MTRSKRTRRRLSLEEVLIGSTIVWIVGVLIAILVILSMSGCAARRVPVIAVVDTTKPIPVLVTTPQPPTCPNLSDPEQMPTAPEAIHFDRDNEDVIDRSFVHARDYNKLVDYIQLDAIWREEFYACIQHITHPSVP